MPTKPAYPIEKPSLLCARSFLIWSACAREVIQSGLWYSLTLGACCRRRYYTL